jgi:hypothetical protein
MYPTGVLKDDGPKSRRLSDIILRQDFTLWRHDREYSREAPMLQLPFEFLLPLNLPSSVHGGSATKGTVSYSVELIVNRRGLTNVDLREGIVFPVVSSASTEELDDAKRLKLGWDGTQVEYEHMKNVTKGFGGGHARVIAQVCLPAHTRLCPVHPFAAHLPERACGQEPVVATTEHPGAHHSGRGHLLQPTAATRHAWQST